MKINNIRKFNQIKKEIEKAKSILLLTHRAPDGDAIGSVLALNLYLKKQKKTTYLYVPAAPRFLSFLPCYDETQKRAFPQKFRFLSSAKGEDFDLIFALDFADKKRLELPQEMADISSSEVITIDHHLNNDGLGKIRLIESNASSTAEILYNFLKYLKIKIDKDLATCLLAGVLTDTGGFSRTNQNHREVEKIIADLILSGGELFKIMPSYQHIDFNRAKLLAKLIERTIKDEKLNLMYSYLLDADFEGERMNLSEPPIFPDFLSRIGDADLYIFLAQQKKGKVKGSIRVAIREGPCAGKINAVKLAERFGGGGHKEASGFTARGEINEVLEELKKEFILQKSKCEKIDNLEKNGEKS